MEQVGQVSLEENDRFMNASLMKFEDVTDTRVNVSMCFGTRDNFKEFSRYHKDAIILRVFCESLSKMIKYKSVTLVINFKEDEEGFKSLIVPNFIIDGTDYSEVIGLKDLNQLIWLLEEETKFLSVVIKTYNKMRIRGKEPTTRERNTIFTNITQLVNIMYEIEQEKNK